MAATVISDLYNLIGNLKDVTFTVDDTLKTPVSARLMELLTEIQNLGNKIQLPNPLSVKESQLQRLNQQHQYLLHLTDQEFQASPGKGIRLSVAQNQFLVALVSTTHILQTYMVLIQNEQVINQAYSELTSLNLLRNSQIADIEKLLSLNSQSAENFIQEITQTTTTSFSDIKNLNEMIDNIKKIIYVRPLTYNASYTFIMLTGPPGTGKTSMARAIANFHSQGKYFNLDMSSLLSQYVGATEKKLTQLFNHVGKNRDQKFTIIMDELDVVLGEKSGNTAYLTTLRNTLQTNLDPENLGPNLVICGLTNHFNQLDAVIKRRATNTFYVPLPSSEDSLMFLVQEILRPFYGFAFNQNYYNLPSPFSDSYYNELKETIQSYADARFSNANMRNIASAAIANATHGDQLLFAKFTLGSKSLLIASNQLPNLNLQSLSEFLPNTLENVDREMKLHPNNYYPYLFIIPTMKDINAGIQQTPFLTTTTELTYQRDNKVNDKPIFSEDDIINMM